MSLRTLKTTAGTAGVWLPAAGYTPGHPPAPTLLLLAMDGPGTLTIDPYNRVGQLLHAHGWHVVSVDLPCHGADARPGEPPELPGWAARCAQGEDFVASFQQRVNDVLAHLVAQGVADPARLAAAGTSRGGYLACQAAAANPLLRAVAAFAPVTELGALHEFAAVATQPLVQRLALQHTVTALAGRALWLIIGDADERVRTAAAVAFATALATANRAPGKGAEVALLVRPVPGHNSLPEWHDEAAAWLARVLAPAAR